MRKVRFAIVGCGRISSHHIAAIYANRDRAEVAAVCDILEDRARAASEKAGGVPWFTDLSDMLRYGQFDVVSVCTPSGLHPEHGITVAEAGFHCVTEKPIGIALKPVDRLIEICERTGRHLFVVMQNRLNPTVRLLRQAVEKGRFGNIRLGQVNVFWTRSQEYYDEAPWRGTRALDGGAFLNQASHYVDLIQWLMGEVESVEAITGTLARRIECEDTGVAILRFRSGALATIAVTMLVYPRNLEGSITLLGLRGTARIGGIALNRIEHWEFDRYQDEDRSVIEASYSPPTVYGHGHEGYYRNVLDVLEGSAKPHTDGREGRKSLELILAIYKAAAEGRRVFLPLEER